MNRSISLDEFVAAFSGYAHDVSHDTFVWDDLKLDDDELSWVLIEIQHETDWVIEFDSAIGGRLRKSTYWFLRPTFVDLTLKELYSYITTIEPKSDIKQ